MMAGNYRQMAAVRIDLVGTTADFRAFGPPRSLPINHLLGENHRTPGRTGEDGLTATLISEFERNGSADRCQDRSIRVPTRPYCDRLGHRGDNHAKATPRDFRQGPARLSPTYWLLPAVPLFSTNKPTNRLIP
jgi:hypothetical protein